MIVRELEDHFIMIEQDDHAHVSGEIISNWQDRFFKKKEHQQSVIDAIYMHDFGWKAFDKQPFWNDEKCAPYTFIDFPTPAKTVLYTHGIDAVEQQDPYAALLCSEHYTRFLLQDDSNEAKAFIKQEHARQQQIITALPQFDQQLFNYHYGLLQLCDNLSLYLCLNEPNAKKDKTHPFFRNGIPVSLALNMFPRKSIQLDWKDENTITIHHFPFNIDLTVKLTQKRLEKETILKQGLAKTYKSTTSQDIEIQLTAKKSP